MDKLVARVIDVQLVLALLLAAALAGVSLVGLRPYVVMSGSMEPALHVGSLAYVDTRIDPASLSAGDIASFMVDGSTTVTHRIESVDVSSGQIVTKGDANLATDPSPIPFSQVIGRLAFSVPFAGAVLDAILSHKAAWIAVLVLFNTALLFASRFLSPKGKRPS